MRRRFRYALTAGFLASGAPAGLLGIRLAKGDPAGTSLDRVGRELATDRAAYLYVGGATAIIFALFGYVLGRQADRLAALSETDSLTELMNSRGFAVRLHAEVKRARRNREPLSLLFVDLDGLKSINDRDGHRAGSDAIRVVARVIRGELRAPDIAARWGGDEFTILAPNTDKTAAAFLAERIRTRIAEAGSERRLTASIGIATLPSDLPTTKNASKIESSALMRAADTALYEAKRQGKNAVVAAN